MKRSNEQRYLETSIATASKEDLIVKIFDVLINSSTQALEKLESELDDIEGIHRHLLRAQRALALLMGSLNMEVGGEIAMNLFRVYEFWHHELVMANMQKSSIRVKRLLPDFKEYRAMWTVAVAEFKTTQRSAAVATPRPAIKYGSPNVGTGSFVAVG